MDLEGALRKEEHERFLREIEIRLGELPRRSYLCLQVRFDEVSLDARPEVPDALALHEDHLLAVRLRPLVHSGAERVLQSIARYKVIDLA